MRVGAWQMRMPARDVCDTPAAYGKQRGADWDTFSSLTGDVVNALAFRLPRVMSGYINLRQ